MLENTRPKIPLSIIIKQRLALLFKKIQQSLMGSAEKRQIKETLRIVRTDLSKLNADPKILAKISSQKNFADILLSSIKNNWENIKYVKDPSFEMILSAVKQSPRAYDFVKQDPVTTERLLKHDWQVIGYAKEQTEQLCKMAINIDPKVLGVIKDEAQTLDVCLYAIKKDPTSLKHIAHQSETLCMEAVSKDWKALKFALYRSPEVCLSAITQSKDAEVDIPLEVLESSEFITQAHRKNPSSNIDIHKPSVLLQQMIFKTQTSSPHHQQKQQPHLSL